MNRSREVELPDGTIVELSPALAEWVLPLREANLDNPERDLKCYGCAVFGICASHGSRVRTVTEMGSAPAGAV